MSVARLVRLMAARLAFPIGTLALALLVGCAYEESYYHGDHWFHGGWWYDLEDGHHYHHDHDHDYPPPPPPPKSYPDGSYERSPGRTYESAPSRSEPPSAPEWYPPLKHSRS
jgi:hypothetical protein